MPALAVVTSVTPVDSATFHYDYGGSAVNNEFACQYKTFSVSFTGSPSSITTTAAITASSPTITLGPGETGTKVWTNPTSPLAVFYYFCAASSSPSTTSYTISANEGSATVTYSGSFVPLNTIKAGNQTINTVATNVASGLITITVTGTAANLSLSSAGRILEVSPNVLKS